MDVENSFHLRYATDVCLRVMNDKESADKWRTKMTRGERKAVLMMKIRDDCPQSLVGITISCQHVIKGRSSSHDWEISELQIKLKVFFFPRQLVNADSLFSDEDC